MRKRYYQITSDEDFKEMDFKIKCFERIFILVEIVLILLTIYFQNLWFLVLIFIIGIPCILVEINIVGPAKSAMGNFMNEKYKKGIVYVYKKKE